MPSAKKRSRSDSAAAVVVEGSVVVESTPARARSNALALSETPLAASATEANAQPSADMAASSPVISLTPRNESSCSSAARDDEKLADKSICTAAATVFSETTNVKEVQLFTSPVIAPQAVGITAMAAASDFNPGREDGKGHGSDTASVDADCQLVVARENGSFARYRVNAFQNVVHFLAERQAGGRRDRTVVRIAFCAGNRAVLAAYRSGQFVLLDSDTLLPLAAFPRVGGGCVLDMVVRGPFVYTASSDGYWKTLYLDAALLSTNQKGVPTALSASKCRLELFQTTPKVSGSDRALCVSVSCHLNMAVGGDDGGNIVAWSTQYASGSSATTPFVDMERVAVTTLWSCRLPKGLPLALSIADVDTLRHSATAAKTSLYTPCVAVGTSIGDVLLLSVSHGTVLHRFSQHKGPVTTFAFFEGTLYASGWQESLRSYRCGAADGEWYPAEVKRRTHYHEATQLLVLSNHRVMVSSSRDGTLMHSNLDTLFQTPAQYVDTTPQQIVFAANMGAVAQTRGNRVEVFRMSSTRTRWKPLFAFDTVGSKVRCGVTGIWCDASLRRMLVATDIGASVIGVWWTSTDPSMATVEAVRGLHSLSACGISDVVFDDEGQNAYVLAVGALLHLAFVVAASNDDDDGVNDDGANSMLDASSRRPLKKRCVTTETNTAVTCISTALNAVYHRVVKTGDTLLLTGEHGCALLRLNADGSVDSSAPPEVMMSHVRRVDNLGNGLALVNGAHYRSVRCCEASSPSLGGSLSQRFASSETDVPSGLPVSLPHDAVFFADTMLVAKTTAPPSASEQTKGIKSSKKGTKDSSASQQTTDGVVPASSFTSKESMVFIPGAFAAFSRGILSVDNKSWTVVHRMPTVAAFRMADGSLLALERNIEGSVEGLPLCWKVRRFGN